MNPRRALKGIAHQEVITHEVTECQQIRLDRTGLRGYIDIQVTAEHALSVMGNPRREDVLMVGDNLGNKEGQQRAARQYQAFPRVAQ